MFKKGKLFVNNAQVTVTNIEADNGLIHIIDSVLIPSTDNKISGTIPEVIRELDSFTALTNALETTGLDTTLVTSDKPFTIFAPTNVAFEALGSDVVNDLVSNNIPLLIDILMRHVIADVAVNSIVAYAMSGQKIPTVNGETVTFSIVDGDFLIDGARVKIFDIPASNGIIHVIDAVIPLEK